MINDQDSLCRMTAKELTNAFRKKTLSPVEVAEATLARATEINPSLNAFASIDRVGALAAARASEVRWQSGAPVSQIDGVPTTIKDVVYVHGWNVRYGSTATDDVSAKPDSPAVERLRRAGAVFIGLTTTPEFGWKAVTDNPKDGVTRNPWDKTKTPGGSSGGAAVAAATGAGVLHLGSDGGGSIRIPASFTGIVGLKPTFGRVAASPASSFGTVAHIGPMARSVEDATRMLAVMEGRDLRDWTQPAQSFAPVSGKAVSWKGKRVGYWRSPCLGKTEPQVSAAVEDALRTLGEAGAIVSEVQLPNRDALLEIFYRHWYVGTATRLALIDPARHVQLDPGFLDAAQKGQVYTAVEHMRAELDRAQYAAKMDALLDQFDLLVSPTVATLPFEAGCNVPDGSDYSTWIEWASFAFPINLSQQPACSVPCGLSAEGLPIGLQIIGPRGADSAVLGAARAYENILPQHFLDGRKRTGWPQVHERS